MKSTLRLAPNRCIGGLETCFIIAEIGQNHNGDIATAKQLILQAKAAGADCVKFQKSCLAAKFTADALDRPYVSLHAFGRTYGEHKAFLELTLDEHCELQRYAIDNDILYSASAMDEVSYEQLKDVLKVPFIKIGSGDANNYLMLERAAQDTATPLIVSTGMQTEAGLNKMTSILRNKSVGLLHCISAYPTPPGECRLRYIERFQEKYPNHVIGYSGHEAVSTLITLGAIALGAKIIERHFTLDKAQKGSDHSCSLTPPELARLTRLIRRVERLTLPDRSTKTVMDAIVGVIAANDTQLNDELGDLRAALSPIESERRIFDCELPCYNKLGKTLVYRKKLAKGKCLERDDLCIKVSNQKGFETDKIDEIVGLKLLKNVEPDQPVNKEQFEGNK